MLDRVYLEDLRVLKNTEYLENIEDDIKYNLSQVGILNQTIKDNRDHEEYVYKNTGRREFLLLMKISKRTAQTWRDEGKISFSQVGNKIYYKLSDVEKLLTEHYNKSFKGR